MKVKQDFVTNSSSTSYIGWGIEIDNYMPEKTWRKLYELAVNSDGWYENMTFEQFVLDGDLNGFMKDLEGTHLYCVENQDEGKYYIGICHNNKESKKGIISKLKCDLKKIGFDDDDLVNIKFIDKEWFEG